MRYKEVDYGGEKIKIKVFDYHTREGWHEFVNSTHGSVDDETFIVPPDLPFAAEEGYLPAFLDALGRFQEQMQDEEFMTDEEVAEWITESRRNEEAS